MPSDSSSSDGRSSYRSSSDDSSDSGPAAGRPSRNKRPSKRGGSGRQTKRMQRLKEERKAIQEDLVERLEAFKRMQDTHIAEFLEEEENSDPENKTYAVRPEYAFLDLNLEQTSEGHEVEIELAKDMLAKLGCIFVNISNIDTDEALKYIWEVMINMPYSNEFLIRATANMADPKLEKDCFKMKSIYNHLTDNYEKYIFVSDDLTKTGRPLDHSIDADWRLIKKIMLNPGTWFIRLWNQNGPYHQSFGAPNHAAASGGPAGGTAEFQPNPVCAVADARGLQDLWLNWFDNECVFLAPPERLIIRRRKQGSLDFSHQDIPASSLKLQADIMDRLMAENPKMTLAEAFIQMTKIIELFRFQGKVMLDPLYPLDPLDPEHESEDDRANNPPRTMKMIPCSNLAPRLFLDIAAYQNPAAVAKNEPKTNLKGKDEIINKWLDALTVKIKGPRGDGVVFFTGTHSHAPNVGETTNFGRFVAVESYAGKGLSDKEIAQRLRNVIQGKQMPKHPSGDIKLETLANLASLSRKYCARVRLKMAAEFQHLWFDRRDANGKIRHWKDFGPMKYLGDWSTQRAPNYFPKDGGPVDPFLPKTVIGKLMSGVRPSTESQFKEEVLHRYSRQSASPSPVHPDVGSGGGVGGAAGGGSRGGVFGAAGGSSVVNEPMYIASDERAMNLVVPTPDLTPLNTPRSSVPPEPVSDTTESAPKSGCSQS